MKHLLPHQLFQAYHFCFLPLIYRVHYRAYYLAIALSVMVLCGGFSHGFPEAFSPATEDWSRPILWSQPGLFGSTITFGSSGEPRSFEDPIFDGAQLIVESTASGEGASTAGGHYHVYKVVLAAQQDGSPETTYYLGHCLPMEDFDPVSGAVVSCWSEHSSSTSKPSKPSKPINHLRKVRYHYDHSFSPLSCQGVLSITLEFAVDPYPNPHTFGFTTLSGQVDDWSSSLPIKPPLFVPPQSSLALVQSHKNKASTQKKPGLLANDDKVGAEGLEEDKEASSDLPCPRIVNSGEIPMFCHPTTGSCEVGYPAGGIEVLMCRNTSLASGDYADKSFRHALISSADFRNSDLTSSDFSGSHGDQALFHNVRGKGVQFSFAVMIGAEFTGAFLSGAEFLSAMLLGTQFDKADLEGADFHSSNLRNASFKSANLKGASFVGAYLKGASFGDADLSGTDFTDADLTGVDFTRARNLESAIGLSDLITVDQTKTQTGVEAGEE